MVFVIYRTHLYREVYTAADLSDAVQQGIGSYLPILLTKGKDKESSRGYKITIL